jgi:hypothetical protein
MAPGDHEVRIDGDRRVVSGECAACGGKVEETDASVVRFATTSERGGIFHVACQPTGAQWYALEDQGEGEE